ncbi:MAG: creatininase family protein [Armatimonadetes bacterium]|nr:creatininase family protein [Armatimonadota bacterium]
MANWNLAETTLGLARDEQYEVAVLPVGATEAHGLHLPYATDTIMVERLGRLACERASGDGARVLLLPALPFGINENTLGFKWTMSLRPSTLFQVVTDIVSSVEEHGIPKMVVLNGHGGNEFQPLLRELFRQTSVRLFLVNWYMANQAAAREVFERPGEHADEMETSMLLHMRPDLVRMELAGDGATREPVFRAMREGWAWVARPWDRFTVDSSFGDPARATAQKGAAYEEAIVGKLAQFITELAAAPVDEMFPYREA